MSVAIALRPTGNPTAGATVVAIDLTGKTPVHAFTDGDTAVTEPDSLVNPGQSTVESYYFLIDGIGAHAKDLKSPVFTPNSDGDWTWDNVVFPEAGSTTIHLKKTSDDSDVATQAVTVE